jgi:hypothetical protein
MINLNLIYKNVLTKSLDFSRTYINMSTTPEPWNNATPFEQVYQHFLESSSDQVKQYLNYNKELLEGLSSNTLSSRIVAAHQGEFLRFETVTRLRPYMSYITFSKFQNVNMGILFKPDIIPRVMGVVNCDPDFAEKVQIAYRNIVPYEFRDESARSCAGPMGCHEYFIDGSSFTPNFDPNQNEDANDTSEDPLTAKSSVNWIANNNPEITPLVLEIKDCQNVTFVVTGLQLDRLQKLFIVSKDTKIEFLPLSSTGKKSYAVKINHK